VLPIFQKKKVLLKFFFFKNQTHFWKNHTHFPKKHTHSQKKHIFEFQTCVVVWEQNPGGVGTFSHHVKSGTVCYDD
jgi:hypothetical protein